MQHQASIKLLTIFTVITLAIVCASVTVLDDEADAASNYQGGSNSSSSSNPYIGVNGFFVNCAGNTIYLVVGSFVQVTSTNSPNGADGGAGEITSVTSGYGLSLTESQLGSSSYSSWVVNGTVSKTGTITIRGDAGTFTIRSVADPSVVSSVSISGSISGEVGDSITLTATTSPSTADNRHVTWSITSGSNNASIRSQTDTTTGGRCVIDLEGAGSVTVRATADDGSGEYDTHRITITEPEILVTSVSISGSTSMKVGDTITLTATTSPSSADDRTVYWQVTSGSSRVSISESDTSTGGRCTIEALSAGTVTIRAYANDGSGEYDTHTITISNPEIEISTSQNDITIITGQEFSLNVATNVSGCTIGVSGADWLSVSGTLVAGTPDSPGEFDITITASRSGYTSDSISFTITVVSALGFTNEPSNGVTVYVVS